jgi:hypothetical protein
MVLGTGIFDPSSPSVHLYSVSHERHPEVSISHGLVDFNIIKTVVISLIQFIPGRPITCLGFEFEGSILGLTHRVC